MKRISFIAYVAILSLSVITAEAQNSSDLSQMAHEAYSEKSYEKALTLFGTLSETEPQNSDTHFYYALSALQLQRYDDALSAFERVLILNPSHMRARLELARLYYETHQYEHALLETNILLESELTPNARESITVFKSKIEKKISRVTFSGNVAVGGGYDSNVNNDIGEKEFFVPLAGTTALGRDETDDTYLYAMAVLHAGYDFGEREGWSLKNTLAGYTRHNTEVEQNDLNFYSLRMTPTWDDKSCKVEFPLEYEHIYLDNDTYLYRLSATAKATYKINKYSQFSGSYGFGHEYYTDSTLDVTSHRIFGSYQQVFGTDPIILSLLAGYIANNALSEVRNDVENHIYQYGIKVSKTLLYNMNGSIGYKGQTIKYEESDPLFGNKRADSLHSFEGQIGYQLKKDTSINAIAGYLNHRSNHAPYDYDKMTLLVNFIYSF